MTQLEHYLISGEFHYFRVPKPYWLDRLQRVRDIGMDSVCIYVPWNWHMPEHGTLDLVGRTLPERDLLGALETIARAGLKCIFRPGPFITNEWRGGGLPDWLWEQTPQLLSLDVNGLPSGRNRAYPAITYAHPAYRHACQQWFEDVIGAVKGYLASQGGPIFHIQIDDEPSYWHLLNNPLMADYNPCLVAHGTEPSLYAHWLLERYGSLSQLNASHQAQYQTSMEIEPPRQPMSKRQQLVLYTDWLDFKLWLINDFSRFLYDTLKHCGVEETISQLYPYLLPQQAAKHTDYLQQHNLPIQLTNEVYLNLFSAATCPEQKVGHVVFCHEFYHMWRGADHGPAITMELQGSNASFITPEAMELLYAITVARGIKGFNIFMMVGGENPSGYENLTGQNYDQWAPISTTGDERLHAGTLRKLVRIIRAQEPYILAAEPLRDAWWGSYSPYETSMLVGSDSAMADVKFSMKQLINSGDEGCADVTSLQALLTLSSASFGCLDLQRATLEQWQQVPQLWVFCLDFMERAVQEKLAAYVQQGGHLVILPMLPHLDERMEPCEVLANLLLSGMPQPAFAGVFPEYPMLYTMVNGKNGENLVVPGKPTLFDLPGDAEALAWQAGDNRPCAFERSVGIGTVTLLGFPLVYMHTASDQQKEFVASIVEGKHRRRWAWASNLQMLAMELASENSGLVCVVNPGDLPACTVVNYTLPLTHKPAMLPLVLEGLTMKRRGARLLPVSLPLIQGVTLRHATWELVGKDIQSNTVNLHFATSPSELGEVALEGEVVVLQVLEGEIQSVTWLKSNLEVLVLQAEAKEIVLQIIVKNFEDSKYVQTIPE